MANFYKKISIYAFLGFSFVRVFAQGGGIEDVNNPGAIAQMLARIIVMALSVGGAVFVFMVGYGAIKLAMSIGDPKGYAGAMSTWQYAIIGFFVVIGVFAIFSIIGNALGLPIFDLNGMVGALESSITSLFTYVQGP